MHPTFSTLIAKGAYGSRLHPTSLAVSGTSTQLYSLCLMSCFTACVQIICDLPTFHALWIEHNCFWLFYFHPF